MSREGWCRDNCDRIIEECGLKERAARDLRKARDFTKEYSLLKPLSSEAVLAVARAPKKRQKLIIQEIVNREKAGNTITEKVVGEIVATLEGGGIPPPPTEQPGGKPAAASEVGKKESARSDEEIAGPQPGPDYELHHSRAGKPYWRKKPVPKPKEPTCKEICDYIKTNYPEIYEKAIVALKEGVPP